MSHRWGSSPSYVTSMGLQPNARKLRWLVCGAYGGVVAGGRWRVWLCQAGRWRRCAGSRVVQGRVVAPGGAGRVCTGAGEAGRGRLGCGWPTRLVFLPGMPGSGWSRRRNWGPLLLRGRQQGTPAVVSPSRSRTRTATLSSWHWAPAPAMSHRWGSAGMHASVPAAAGAQPDGVPSMQSVRQSSRHRGHAARLTPRQV